MMYTTNGLTVKYLNKHNITIKDVIINKIPPEVYCGIVSTSTIDVMLLRKEDRILLIQDIVEEETTYSRDAIVKSREGRSRPDRDSADAFKMSCDMLRRAGLGVVEIGNLYECTHGSVCSATRSIEGRMTDIVFMETYKRIKTRLKL